MLRSPPAIVPGWLPGGGAGDPGGRRRGCDLGEQAVLTHAVAGDTATVGGVARAHLVDVPAVAREVEVSRRLAGNGDDSVGAERSQRPVTADGHAADRPAGVTGVREPAVRGHSHPADTALVEGKGRRDDAELP